MAASTLSFAYLQSFRRSVVLLLLLLLLEQSFLHPSMRVLLSLLAARQPALRYPAVPFPRALGAARPRRCLALGSAAREGAAEPWRRGDPRAAAPCEATVTNFGPLGASVDVELRDGSFARGLILQSELKYLREARFGDGAEVGETLSAWAVATRDDGKLDVYLRAPTAKGKSDDAKGLIMAALRERGGVLDVGDKSPPAEIAAVLPGLSKSVFKNAVGALFREGKVVPSRHETKLAPPKS